jgi:hypothetical protein
MAMHRYSAVLNYLIDVLTRQFNWRLNTRFLLSK